MSTNAGASKNFLQFLTIVIVCSICYYNSTQCALVFDDISAIKDNKDLRPNTPLRNIFLNDFWGTPMRKEQSHKSYRPLTVLTFRWNYFAHQLDAFGYHFVNVILHIVVCLLYKKACRLLLPSSRGERNCSSSSLPNNNNTNSCFIATLLFAVHPIHTEAVTGIVGRAELLSSIFYLGAFLTYASAVQQTRKRTKWTSLFTTFLFCLLCSMLCKEQGITIAGICAAYEIFVIQQMRPIDLWNIAKNLFEEKKSIVSFPHSAASSQYVNKITVLWTTSLVKRIGFLACSTIILLFGRLYVMGSQLPVFTRFDNPASAAETPSRQLTFSYLIYLNCWLLIFPCDLCCDWTMGEFK